MDTSQTAKIVKFDSAKRIVYGEVYAPYVLDSHGDFMCPEEIEKMAHDFLRKGFVNEIDTEHDLENNGSAVVESFVARPGDPDFTEGAWVMGVHVPGDAEWAMVEKGELCGFSMYGEAKTIDTFIEVEVPDDGIAKGETQTCSDHQHQFIVKFDESGKFLGGETDEVDGHKHTISRGTVTDDAAGHNHRYNFRETSA